ncbi:hypothetical protein WKT22_02795 [Candidatus Lokiarchaeum ossiferum]
MYRQENINRIPTNTIINGVKILCEQCYVNNSYVSKAHFQILYVGSIIVLYKQLILEGKRIEKNANYQS